MASRKKAKKATKKNSPHRARARERKKQVRLTDEMMDEALQAIARGMTLSDFCRQPGKPERSTFAKAIDRASPELGERWRKAREEGYDVLAEQALAIADEPIGYDENGKTDSGMVQHRRLRIDTRLRLLSKWCSGRYGDKLELNSGEGGLTLNVVTGVPREK